MSMVKRVRHTTVGNPDKRGLDVPISRRLRWYVYPVHRELVPRSSEGISYSVSKPWLSNFSVRLFSVTVCINWSAPAAVRQMGVDLDGHRDIRADLAEGLCQVAVPRARSVGTSGIVRQANARHFAQYCRDRPTAETSGACAKQALTVVSGLP